jgi:hypothetical protein
MIILSKSNVAPLATITDSDTSPTQDVAVIADGDFSSTYTKPLSGSTAFYFNYSVTQTVRYVAVFGNISQKVTLRIRIDGVTAKNITPMGTNDSQVMFVLLDADTPADLVEVSVFGSGSISVVEIAMGEVYTVPHGGEQAGFKYPWSIPNRQTRSARSLSNSPVAITYDSKKISCTLSVPDRYKTDSAWYEFLDFSSLNTFYMRGNSDFEACACFNPMQREDGAHNATRELLVSGLTFDTFSKGDIL